MIRLLAAVFSIATVLPLQAGLKTDIEFAKAGDVSLTLDAYTPDGDGPFPTCILVHGGGFTNGDKTSYIKPLFDPLSKAGFTWFTINYRLAPQHTWPACADDVASAIRWVREHAAEYKVDPKRIALIGESAGGHLVAWGGIADQGNPPLAAVVPFYAPSDMVRLMKGRSEVGGIGSLLGITGYDDASWRKIEAISPITKIRPGLPPFLLIHGDKDARVPLEQSLVFQKAMKDAGNTCDLVTVPGGGHGMGDWHKLKSDYQTQLVDWLRAKLK